MNNGTSFHFCLKPERNKSPSKKKKKRKKGKKPARQSCLTPTPLLNNGLIYSSILTEFAVCLKTVYYKHL